MSMIASDSRKENEYAFTSRMSTMGLKPGGNYKPENCYSRNKVALIVPYRRREFHLKIFLRYMHPFLQRQQLQYVIFIVEQTSKSSYFNLSLSYLCFSPNQIRWLTIQPRYAYEHWIPRGSETRIFSMFYFSRRRSSSRRWPQPLYMSKKRKTPANGLLDRYLRLQVLWF